MAFNPYNSRGGRRRTVNTVNNNPITNPTSNIQEQYKTLLQDVIIKIDQQKAKLMDRIYEQSINELEQDNTLPEQFKTNQQSSDNPISDSIDILDGEIIDVPPKTTGGRPKGSGNSQVKNKHNKKLNK